jgi:hypothetical protein
LSSLAPDAVLIKTIAACGGSIKGERTGIALLERFNLGGTNRRLASPHPLI